MRYAKVKRRMRGRGLMDFIGKALGFLKKHKVISKLGGSLGGMLPGKYGAVASGVGNVAGSLGFGRRRRRRCGRGLRLAGH